MPLQVELVSADRKVWSGEARQVVARTVDGEIGVLTGHAPLLAVLAEGDVVIMPSSGSPVTAHCQDGFISVEHNRVTLVSDSAALASSSSR